MLLRLNRSGRYREVRPRGGVLPSQVLPGFYLRPEWCWQDELPDELPIRHLPIRHLPLGQLAPSRVVLTPIHKYFIHNNLRIDGQHSGRAHMENTGLEVASP
jgi:hypothetical protein